MTTEGSVTCPDCARRGLLLSALAGHIDRSVDGRVGERAKDLLALGDESLVRAVDPRGESSALERADDPLAYQRLLDSLRSTGCWSTCVHRSDFPSSLRVLGEAMPRALFCSGERSALTGAQLDRSVTIVGSRRAGAYGREIAHELSRLLASSGLTVISGMALGVDSAAHEGALAGGGPTVAVLGAGADRPYPRTRSHLFTRIRARGTVISELPPCSPTFRWVFPARNRLMAAMGAITIVVEAAERSGSLITAEMAMEIGRQVGAVPGPVNSWRSGGANRLLADGAAVIREARDVLDLLLGPGAEVPPAYGPPLDGEVRTVLAAVEDGAATPGAVASQTSLPFPATQAALGRLERLEYVRSDAAGRLARTAQQAPPP